MKILFYEFKMRTKSWWFLFYGTLLMITTYIIFRLLPSAAVSVAQFVNHYKWLRTLLGLTKELESITYENIMIAFFTPFTIIMLYINMIETADSILREKQLGTILYYVSQSVTRFQLLLSKLATSLVLFLLQITIWGLLLWRFSLTGIAHVEFFYNIITEEILSVLTFQLFIGLLSILTGFLYGCFSKRKHSSYFAGNLFSIFILFSILPNILGCCGIWLKNQQIDTSHLSSVIEITRRLRSLNPLYQCCPSIVIQQKLPIDTILICVAIGIFTFLVGCIVYCKRDLTSS